VSDLEKTQEGRLPAYSPKTHERPSIDVSLANGEQKDIGEKAEIGPTVSKMIHATGFNHSGCVVAHPSVTEQ
jgi:hypothetical protein